MIELRVLGTLDVRAGSDGRPIAAVVAQPKRSAFLAYLAVARPRGPHKRDTLLVLFWPESTQERARNSLNQTVFNLRRALGEATILASGDELRLDNQAVWCDAVAFEKALDEGDLPAALSLYKGDLLPGLHLDGCSEFEHWLDSERSRLRRRAVAAGLSLADAEERDGNRVAAIDVLRRTMEWAPDDEAPVLRVVGLLAAVGDRPGAIREYERFSALIADQLDLEPSEQLKSIISTIRDGPPDSTSRLDRGDGQGTPVPTAAAASSGQSSRTLRRMVVAGTLVVVAAAAAAVGRARLPGDDEGPSSLLDRKRVLVAQFENRTGDSSLAPIAHMASDWISQGLAQSGLARPIPLSTIVQEAPHLGDWVAVPAGTLVGANREFARRVRAGILVAGAFYRSNDSLVLQGQILDVATGEVLRAIDEVRGAATDPAGSVEVVQRRILGAMAILYDERLNSWPDRSEQPSNPESYRYFSSGMSAFMRGMATLRRDPAPFIEAGEHFMAAARLDSAFVMPLLWAGYAYTNAGLPSRSTEILSALERRSLSRWSRAVVDHQTAHLRGDLEAEYLAARELAELSPDSEWLMKLAHVALVTGRYNESAAILRRLDPETGWLRGWVGYWRLLSEAEHAVGRADRALAAARRGLERHPDDEWSRTQALWANAALGRTEPILSELREAVERADPYALWRLSSSLEEMRSHGHAAAERRIAADMVPKVRAVISPSTPAPLRFASAQLFEQGGAVALAESLFAVIAAEVPHAIEARVRGAVLAARRGDAAPAAAALRLLEEADEEFVRRAFPSRQAGLWGSPQSWFEVQKARLLVALDRQDEALESLRRARSAGLLHAYLILHDDPDFDRLRRSPAFRRFLVRD